MSTAPALDRLVLTEDDALADELAARRAAGPGRWPVPVGDLLDPRPAYYRRVAPVPLPPERKRLRAIGSARHALWLGRLGPVEEREVRVQRDGVVGVVDLLERSGPTELKTTAHLPPPDRWLSERPAYFDQLGLYAALTDRPHGRLVVADSGAGATELGAVACEYGDLSGLRGDAVARAERLRRALRGGGPDALPRCQWFGDRCPFRKEGICGCTGAEPADAEWVRSHLERVVPAPETEERWREAVRSSDGAGDPVLRSFGDLLFPRFAAFDRLDPGASETTPAIDAESQATYRELVAALDAGPDNERSQRPAGDGEPLGAVPLFRGRPYLIKTRRGRPPRKPATPSDLSAHYLEELAFRCVKSGAEGGYLVLDASGARPPERRLRVIRVDIPEKELWSDELERRRAALARAVARGDPTLVPACPGWRAEFCAYRSRCGCATGGPAA